MATQAFDAVALSKMEQVRAAKNRIATRSAARLEALRPLVERLEVAEGQSWTLEGTAHHRLRVGDGLAMTWPDMWTACAWRLSQTPTRRLARCMCGSASSPGVVDAKACFTGGFPDDRCARTRALCR